eukprot:scaffold538_cov413-Pavlova_lutheri.AAC.7
MTPPRAESRQPRFHTPVLRYTLVREGGRSLTTRTTPKAKATKNGGRRRTSFFFSQLKYGGEKLGDRCSFDPEAEEGCGEAQDTGACRAWYAFPR